MSEYLFSLSHLTRIHIVTSLIHQWQICTYISNLTLSSMYIRLMYTSPPPLTTPSVPLATFLPLLDFWQRMAVLYLAHRASSVWSCSWKRAKIPTYVMKNGERRKRKEEILHAWSAQDDGICVYQIRSEEMTEWIVLGERRSDGMACMHRREIG